MTLRRNSIAPDRSACGSSLEPGTKARRGCRGRGYHSMCRRSAERGALGRARYASRARSSASAEASAAAAQRAPLSSVTRIGPPRHIVTYVDGRGGRVAPSTPLRRRYTPDRPRSARWVIVGRRQFGEGPSQRAAPRPLRRTRTAPLESRSRIARRTSPRNSIRPIGHTTHPMSRAQAQSPASRASRCRQRVSNTHSARAIRLRTGRTRMPSLCASANVPARSRCRRLVPGCAVVARLAVWRSDSALGRPCPSWVEGQPCGQLLFEPLDAGR